MSSLLAEINIWNLKFCSREEVYSVDASLPHRAYQYMLAATYTQYIVGIILTNKFTHTHLLSHTMSCARADSPRANIFIVKSINTYRHPIGREQRNMLSRRVPPSTYFRAQPTRFRAAGREDIYF